jgi:hypothetical protein
VDVNAVLEGLRDNASAIEELRCFEYVPDNVAPPCFFPVGVVIEYADALVSGMDALTVNCQLLVSRASDRSGQRLLKEYLSNTTPRSVVQALRADPSLGGACHDLQIRRISGYSSYNHANTWFYGAVIETYIIGPNT